MSLRRFMHRRTKDEELAEEIESHLAHERDTNAARGLSSQAIISGAGHDAQEMAHVCTAGMVFVPGEYDGISHNPREYSTRDQCGKGIDVMCDVVLSFANE